MSCDTRASIVSCPRKERCELCRQRIGERDLCVAANVYRDGAWHHLEHFHQSCYSVYGEPFGPPAKRKAPSRQITIHHTKQHLCKTCGQPFMGVPAAKNCETCRRAA